MIRPFASPQWHRRCSGVTQGDECCLCGKHTSGLAGAIHVAVNHEQGEFVTDEQAEALGDAVSLFPIGPECVKLWRREIGGTSSRLRMTGKGVVAYDHKK